MNEHEQKVLRIRARLQRIARLAEKELPGKTGFFFMAFPFGAPVGTRGEYVSNAKRQEIMQVMAEFLRTNHFPVPEQN